MILYNFEKMYYNKIELLQALLFLEMRMMRTMMSSAKHFYIQWVIYTCAGNCVLAQFKPLLISFGCCLLCNRAARKYILSDFPGTDNMERYTDR